MMIFLLFWIIYRLKLLFHYVELCLLLEHFFLQFLLLFVQHRLLLVLYKIIFCYLVLVLNRLYPLKTLYDFLVRWMLFHLHPNFLVLSQLTLLLRSFQINEYPISAHYRVLDFLVLEFDQFYFCFSIDDLGLRCLDLLVNVIFLDMSQFIGFFGKRAKLLLVPLNAHVTVLYLLFFDHQIFRWCILNTFPFFLYADASWMSKFAYSSVNLFI